MTDPHPATLPTITLVTVKFVQWDGTTWLGTADCIHGRTQNTTYLSGTGSPPLNHAQMVQSLYRQHDLVIGCNCAYDTPKPNVTSTFQLPTAVPPGQQRYVPMTAAAIQVPANWFFGPGLTCARTGAYAVVAKVQLAGSARTGARGLGVILVSGQPVLNVQMVDETSKATANINAILNLAANQSLAVGYENQSTSNQDVTLTTLSVGEVWVP
jgi:hypothetical protein